MKKNLLVFITFILIGGSQVNAQATRLSNNTDLQIGFPISSTKAIFTQAVDPSAQDTRYNLWVTDGTVAGTVQLAIPATLESADALGFWNNKLYFSGYTAANGAELWVTDGTVAGTSMVKDINAGTGSSLPTHMIVYNNTLYFYAFTPVNGAELWKSDGTSGGTVLVKDINPGVTGSLDQNISYTVLNNEIYFSAVTATNGLELWKSNGTDAGTVLIKDINPGINPSTPQFLEFYNNQLFFTADNGTNGEELWKTDGTTGGTVLVKDIATGAAGSNIQNAIIFHGKILFSAEAASGNSELYSSDGTTGGTVLLKEINSGAVGSDPEVAGGIIINNKLIFPATSAATGRELYVTDGTEAGTVLFKDIVPGAVGSDPVIWLDRNFLSFINAPGSISSINETLYNGKIFFQTGDLLGSQLWITDGTAANTVSVKDFAVGSLLVSSYFYTQSGLYFAGGDLTAGIEVFKSVGTAATTDLYADINPGVENSIPFFQFFILNGKVFFTADDGDSPSGQRDLFVLDGTELPLPLQLLSFAAASTGSGVKLGWATINESNSKEFEVQRSVDGNNFRGIGFVQANAQPQSKKEYDYLDMDAYKQKSTTLYYRLKMIDNDGKYAYSKVALIQLDRVVKGLEVSPNPARGFVRINYASDTQQDAQVRIINANGQIVQSFITHLSPGVNQQVVNTERMAPGIYHTELIINGKKTQTARFVKQ